MYCTTIFNHERKWVGTGQQWQAEISNIYLINRSCSFCRISFFHYFTSFSKSICHDQQQFFFHSTFNVLVILAQSAHRGGSPCGSTAWQHGNCLCLMFQIGALGGTRSSVRPSATGYLTVFYSTPLFLSSERKKSMELWRCRRVCALQCQFPRRISSVQLIPKLWRGGLVCCA